MAKGKRRGPGEGTIFFRKDLGLYVAELRLDPGPDGKIRVWRKYSKLRRVVADELGKALHAKARGELLGTGEQTVAEYLAEWIAGQKEHLAPQTYPSYESKIRLHLVPALGHLTLAKLTPQHVQRVLDNMHARGLAPRTIAYTRAVLRAALADCVRWGIVQRNAAALAEPPKIQRPDVKPINVDDAKKILAAVTGHRLEALFSVVLAIGLRQGEALGLGWADVDLDRGDLRVIHALQTVDGTLQVRETKTAGSVRVIALPRFAVAALREHRRRQLEERLRAGAAWRDQGLVFTTPIGTPVDRHKLSRDWKKILQDASVPHARFYDLRHTCASLLAARGLSLKEVSQLLGHSTIRVTADFYTHLFPAGRGAAADAMDALFERPARELL